MSMVTYNTTLEYATNTVELRLYDDAGAPVSFAASTVFTVERIDDPNSQIIVAPQSISGNHIVFSVAIPQTLTTSGGVYKVGDNLYSYDDPVYEHIYSVKSNSDVYIKGKLNLVKVA